MIDNLFCLTDLFVRINSETLVELCVPSEAFRGDLKRSCLLSGKSYSEGGEDRKCTAKIAGAEHSEGLIGFAYH